MSHYEAAEITVAALAIGGLAGLVAGMVSGIRLLAGGARGLRSESELNAALGEPLLATRPFAAQELARQLLAHWVARSNGVLPIVSGPADRGRTRAAAELARALAQQGAPTLLIDADLRSPRVHREFGLRNRAGLADFLEGRRARLARCADNLSVLVAGRSSADPLELLSERKLQQLLAAAGKRYRVILVDTPAAERGPDLQLFAAFGGGALVVVQRPSAVAPLHGLRLLLQRCRARVIGTVLSTA